MLHVLVGENVFHDRLPKYAAAHRPVNWIVPKAAKRGDQAVLFMPDHGFVGTATVVTMPIPSMHGRRRTYASKIRIVRVFPAPVPLATVQTRLPEWKWPQYPRSFTSIHGSIEAALLATLETSQSQRTRRGMRASTGEVAALEGMARETRALTRGRSAALRARALANAQGVCAACGTDYSRFLGGLGARVLVVHHKRDLASSTSPRVTRLDDLAVVCANCHALIHLAADATLTVEDLGMRLRAQRTGKTAGRLSNG